MELASTTSYWLAVVIIMTGVLSVILSNSTVRLRKRLQRSGLNITVSVADVDYYRSAIAKILFISGTCACDMFSAVGALLIDRFLLTAVIRGSSKKPEVTCIQLEYFENLLQAICNGAFVCVALAVIRCVAMKCVKGRLTRLDLTSTHLVYLVPATFLLVVGIAVTWLATSRPNLPRNYILGGVRGEGEGQGQRGRGLESVLICYQRRQIIMTTEEENQTHIYIFYMISVWLLISIGCILRARQILKFVSSNTATNRISKKESKFDLDLNLTKSNSEKFKLPPQMILSIQHSMDEDSVSVAELTDKEQTRDHNSSKVLLHSTKHQLQLHSRLFITHAVYLAVLMAIYLCTEHLLNNVNNGDQGPLIYLIILAANGIWRLLHVSTEKWMREVISKQKMATLLQNSTI